MGRSGASDLRLGIESWAQADIALRHVGRDGGPQVLRHREGLDGAIAIAALRNVSPRILMASCWV